MLVTNLCHTSYYLYSNTFLSLSVRLHFMLVEWTETSLLDHKHTHLSMGTLNASAIRLSLIRKTVLIYIDLGEVVLGFGVDNARTSFPLINYGPETEYGDDPPLSTIEVLKRPYLHIPLNFPSEATQPRSRSTYITLRLKETYSLIWPPIPLLSGIASHLTSSTRSRLFPWPRLWLFYSWRMAPL